MTTYFKKDLASVQWPLATGRVGYVTHVQDWTCVAYPMCLVALATGQKPHPFKNLTVGLRIFYVLNKHVKYYFNQILFTI